MKKKLGAPTSGKTTWRCDSHQGEWSLGILLPQQINHAHAVFQGEVGSQLADLQICSFPSGQERKAGDTRPHQTRHQRVPAAAPVLRQGSGSTDPIDSQGFRSSRRGKQLQRPEQISPRFPYKSLLIPS